MRRCTRDMSRLCEYAVACADPFALSRTQQLSSFDQYHGLINHDHMIRSDTFVPRRLLRACASGLANVCVFAARHACANAMPYLLSRSFNAHDTMRTGQHEGLGTQPSSTLHVRTLQFCHAH